MTDSHTQHTPPVFASSSNSRRLKPWTIATAAALVIAVAFFVWLGTRAPDLPPETVALGQNGTAGAPGEERAAVIALEAEDPHVFKGEINPGDTAGTILYDWIPQNDIQSMIDACKNIYSLSRLRAGNPYTVIADEEGLNRFEYEIDADQKLVINRTQGNYEACLEAIAYDIRLTLIDIKIDSNLFQAVADAGEGPNLAISLADIFGWEVDFIKSIREGDTFRVLVEKRYQEGEFKRYGPILAARFNNQGKEYEAFYYEEKDGPQFFTRSGDSMKRAFLKAPLSFTRISSGYNLRRLHPIFKEVRPHPAIDYAAPTGTPVKAIGNGTITYAGWGKGAGKHIVLRHSNGYESIYMHLSGFAKGIKQKSRVQQGQVIGYVGSTGYSTGPHLDFRVKLNGKYVNPASITSPRSDPVSKQNLAEFKDKVELYLTWLDQGRPLSDYALAMAEDGDVAENAPVAGQTNSTAPAPQQPQDRRDARGNDGKPAPQTAPENEPLPNSSGPADH